MLDAVMLSRRKSVAAVSGQSRIIQEPFKLLNRVVLFYNQRGKAEQWIQAGMQALKWTKLSCSLFRDNQVRLQLIALAYNFGNFLRQLALPRPVRYWSLTTLREKLIRIGARGVQKARGVTFQLAEVAVPRRHFAQILRRIERLRPTLAPG